MSLTHKQLRALTAIRDYIEQHGASPSTDQIARRMGIRSRGNAHRYVTALEERGFIKTVPGKVRTIELLKFPENARRPFLPAGSEVGANHVLDYGHCRDYVRLRFDVGGYSWQIAIRVTAGGSVQPPCINWSGGGGNGRNFSPVGHARIPQEITDEATRLEEAILKAIK